MVIGKNIKAVLFDLDGTVFNLAVDWQSLENDLKPYSSKDLNLAETIQKLIKEQRTEAIKLVEDAEILGVENGNEIPGAAQVMNTISSTRSVMLVTRNTRVAAQRALRKMGIKNIGVIGKEDVKNVKPDPEAIIKACTTLGILPSNCVFVGDTYHDIEAAHQAGAKCVIIKNDSLEYIPQGADLYLDLIKDLPSRLV